MKSKIYLENDHIRIMRHDYFSLLPIFIISIDEPIYNEYGKWTGLNISIGILCWAVDINL